MHTDTRRAAPTDVGSYAPPSAGTDAPITTRSLLLWLPVIGMILSIGVAWGLTTAALASKIDEVTYRKDQTELANKFGELGRQLEQVGGDVRVVRACLTSKAPENCR